MPVWLGVVEVCIGASAASAQPEGHGSTSEAQAVKRSAAGRAEAIKGPSASFASIMPIWLCWFFS